MSIKDLKERVKKTFSEKEQLLDTPREVPELAEDLFEDDKQLVQDVSIATNSQKEEVKVENVIKEPVKPIVPDELPGAKKLVVQESISVNEPKKAMQEIKSSIPAPPVNVKPQAEYFAKLENIMSDDKAAINDILSKDLLNDMKDYYSKNPNAKIIDDSKGEIEVLLKLKIRELEDFEREWLENRKIFDDLKLLLLKKENQIRNLAEEVKSLFKRLREANIAISPDKYFGIADGRLLKGITELKTALMNMKDEVFEHHVTKERNDFASWVEGVFNMKNLASKLKSTKKPQEMVAFIEEEGF
ncbi:hypothetical protein GOV04_03130 [Candidatus Woesearchaeota archaeon]|nr:hypothetical protein [Candidatus Woesearchaeota archaeon]